MRRIFIIYFFAAAWVPCRGNDSSPAREAPGRRVDDYPPTAARPRKLQLHDPQMVKLGGTPAGTFAVVLSTSLIPTVFP